MARQTEEYKREKDDAFVLEPEVVLCALGVQYLPPDNFVVVPCLFLHSQSMDSFTS